MLNISYELASLMCEWSENHRVQGLKNFISDGVVNADIYQNYQPKIAFFLKEAYSKEGDCCWSLTEWLNRGAMTRMWSTVAEWTYGIRNTTETLIPHKPQLSNEEKTKLLQTIAIVNVKKSNGEARSNYQDLLQYTKKDRFYLKKELEILSPDIIVCGNNSSLLRAIYGARIQDDTVHADGDIDYEFIRKNGYVIVNNQIIIDFYHPANQYPSILNYYAVCGLYQQALKKKGNGK